MNSALEPAESDSRNELDIRDARPEEFEEVGRLMIAAYSALDGFPKPRAQPAYYEALAKIGEQTAKPGVRLLAAFDGLRLVGAVVYFPDMNSIWIGRNRNSGKKLFRLPLPRRRP